MTDELAKGNRENAPNPG